LDTSLNTTHEILWDDIKVSRLWDFYARTLGDEYFSKSYGHQILTLCNISLNETLDVLDFGCGPGYIWDHLKKLRSCWKYSGLDFSSSSIQELINKTIGQDNFKQALRVTKLPTELGNAIFDVVLLLEVIEHLDDPHLDGTLSEIARVIKSGGALIITTPNQEDLSKSKKCCPECGAIFHEWQHVRSWSISSLSEHLMQHGFSLNTAKTLDFSTTSYTPIGVYRKVKRLAKRYFRGDLGTPHLLAIYRKN